MRGLSQVIKAVATGLAANGKSRNTSKRQNKSRPGRINVGQGTGAWGRALPASYASHVKAGFRIISKSSTSTRVAGCDLVYPLPGSVASKSGLSDFLFSVIPANPAYWTGTRVAQLAPAYMNYRPLALTFHYIPQVAVTQAGSVIYGTLWNGAAPSGDLQQTLNTSNGGGIINCYVPSSTRIALGNNLQQNLFTLNGDINPDTSPFMFVAVARGCVNEAGTNQVVPGYFMVDYVYEFKNPVGQSWVYDRTLATPLQNLSWALPNRSVVLLESISGYGPGTIFDCETDSSGNTSYYYRGSSVSIPPETYVQAFENGQTSSIQALARSAGSPVAFLIESSNLAMTYYPNGTTISAFSSSEGAPATTPWFIVDYGHRYVVQKADHNVTTASRTWVSNNSVRETLELYGVKGRILYVQDSEESIIDGRGVAYLNLDQNYFYIQDGSIPVHTTV